MSKKPLLRYAILSLFALAGLSLLFFPRRHEIRALAFELPIASSWALVSFWGLRVFSRQRGLLADTVPIELSVRLSPKPEPAGLWESTSGLLLSIAWNCAFFALLTDVNSWHLIFVLLFSAGSLWSSLGLLKPVLLRRKIGDTLVEMNAESFELNQSAKLRVKQLGEGLITHLSARLICEERTRAGEGKAARRESRVVAEYPIVEASNIVVTRAKRAVFDKEIQLPPGAMHSFQSTYNSIEWYVRIELKAALTPGLRCAFLLPVVVRRRA